MTCGCKDPNSDHGDPRNLTLDAFVQAAEAANIGLAEAIDNVSDTYDVVADREDNQGRD